MSGTREEILDRAAHSGRIQDAAVFADRAGDRPSSATSESRHGLDSLLIAVKTMEHSAKANEAERLGYRPTSVSVCGDEVVSLWWRPMLEMTPAGQVDRRVAQAAAVLLRWGEEESVWPLFRRTDDPGVRAYLIHFASRLSVDPRRFIARYSLETDSIAKAGMIAALAEYPPELTNDKDRLAFLRVVKRDYLDNSDAGLHSALRLLLDRWEGKENRRKLDAEAASRPEAGKPPGWHVNGIGMTFVGIAGPVEFDMGRPTWLREEEQNAHRHRVRIERDFEISSTEVTVEQFMKVIARDDNLKREWESSRFRRFSPDADCPMTSLTWAQAAKFCLLLDQFEGVPAEERCYEIVAEDDVGISHRAGYLSKAGHRLPTEAEWEYAARGGYATLEPYGRSDFLRGNPELLGARAWCLYNASNMTHSVGSKLPNEFGLFDMLGNAHEWCDGRRLPYCEGNCHVPKLDREDELPIQPRINRVLRGSWFGEPLAAVQIDSRSWNWPIYPSVENGLRVARTLKRK